MLKQRLITAAVLIAVLLAALFLLPSLFFSILMAVVIMISAYEWAGMSGFTKPWQKIIYCLLILDLMYVLGKFVGLPILGEAEPNTAIRDVMVGACGFWAVALLWVQGYPSSSILWGRPFVRLIMGFFVLVPAWVALSFLHQEPNGYWLVLAMIGIVVLADSGGYFFGRAFGRRKLAPAVSPGKTWEGFFGGLFTNLIVAALVIIFTNIPWQWTLAVIIPTSLISVLGDLLESMVKRHAGVKDSGALLPGHGGVMDRVDAMAASAPVFALAYIAIGASSLGMMN
ncbi:MAG: phosphatidate cytidylyltransferase [Cellvibrio sp.]